MQRDRKRRLVHCPQLLEDGLGLRSGVDEDERHPGALDRAIDVADAVARRVAGPGNALIGVQNGDIGSCSFCALHQGREFLHALLFPLRFEPGAQPIDIGNGRRKTDAAMPGCQRLEPCEAERQQRPALRGGERVQLVDDHPAHRAEHPWRFRHGNEQRHLLGRGDQDVGRMMALALALGGRRVAGPRLDADRQAHLARRPFEIACDVDGQRLERRHIKRVEPLSRLHREFAQRRQKARQRLAAAGRSDQQHRAAGPCLGKDLDLVLPRCPATCREPVEHERRQLAIAFPVLLRAENGAAAGESFRPFGQASAALLLGPCRLARLCCRLAGARCALARRALC
jgi:hypothetical protein